MTLLCVLFLAALWHSVMSRLTKVACVGELKCDSGLFLSGIQQTLIVHSVIARLCSVCTAGLVQKKKKKASKKHQACVVFV